MLTTEKKPPLWIWGLAGLALLALLVAAFSRADEPERWWLDDEAAGELHKPSPYGILTSARWSWGAEYVRTDLEPVANTNPHPEPQPHRDHPYGVELAADGSKVYVALSGTEAEPGSEVAVFDLGQREVLRRITVGLRPTYLALAPDGRHLVVLNRYSNYASVIDTLTDEVTSEIPLDYYCMDLVFTSDGKRAFVSNRYLDQVLVLDVELGDGSFAAEVRPLGGFDPAAFLEPAPEGNPNLHELLQTSCGTAGCHQNTKGGYYAGADAERAWFSALENCVAGDPDESLLLRAVRPVLEGGFADDLAGSNFHAAGKVVWRRSAPGYRRVEAWIRGARVGPGIPIGNPGSKPEELALSSDERTLYVGNTGTTDIAIVDVARLEEVSAIYTQNVITGLEVVRDELGGRDLLLATSMGLGFGAAKERDPYGGETEDATNPAAQYTVLRDVGTTEPLPLEEQEVLGPFDAIDGTAASKMADIQNDLLVVDLSRLELPAQGADGQLRYALLANRYEAHADWVRYTSDSAEVLPMDFRGDIPPDLQRVVGAFPEAIRSVDNRVFVLMMGTNELVEWRLDARAGEHSDVLEPVAVHETGLLPREFALGRRGTRSQGLALVANLMGETLSVIDTGSGRVDEYAIGDLSRPFPDSDAERGEFFVHSCVFSVDEDVTCASCHIYDTSDGRGWGAGQAIAQMQDGKFVNGGTLAIPQLRNLFATQPFYFEGTHTAYDAQFDDAREQVALQGFLEPNVHGDFTEISHPTAEVERLPEHEEIQDKMSTDEWGSAYSDLRERRDAHTRRLTMEYFGKAYNFRDLQRFIGEYQAAETRLTPNPYDTRTASVTRGKLLFANLSVGCVVCHPAPNFTDKSEVLYHNEERSLPSLITFTRREKSFTLVGPHWMDSVNGYERDLEPWEVGRVERVQGNVTSFPLRGLFNRPFTFLHHGRALTLRESFSAPDHYALRKFKYPPLRGGEPIRPGGRERGFNELSFLEERTYMLDTHGATSHLTAQQVRDLEHFLLSIE